MENEITEKLIRQGINGEERALSALLQYFDKTINKYATRWFTDGSGDLVSYVDPDVKAQLQEKIITATFAFGRKKGIGRDDEQDRQNG